MVYDVRASEWPSYYLTAVGIHKEIHLQQANTHQLTAKNAKIPTHSPPTHTHTHTLLIAHLLY